MYAYITCAACRHRLRIPDTAVGKTIQCPLCQSVFTSAPEPSPARPPADRAPTPGPAAEPERPWAVSERPRPASGPLAGEEPGRRGRDLPGEYERPPRRRRSRRDKPAGSGQGWLVALSIGGAALLVAGLAVAAVLLLKKAGGSADSDWREFTSAEGRYRVLLPGTPRHQTQNQPTMVGNILMHLDVVERNGGRSGFCVLYADFPFDRLDPVQEKQVLDFGVMGGAMGAKGKLVSSRDVTLGAHRGKEMEIDVPGKGKMIGRIYLVRNRLYILLAAGPGLSAASPDVTKFWGSFQLLDGGPTATRRGGVPPSPCRNEARPRPAGSARGSHPARALAGGGAPLAAGVGF
jgi:hypothetical protein